MPHKHANADRYADAHGYGNSNCYADHHTDVDFDGYRHSQDNAADAPDATSSPDPAVKKAARR